MLLNIFYVIKYLYFLLRFKIIIILRATDCFGLFPFISLYFWRFFFICFLSYTNFKLWGSMSYTNMETPRTLLKIVKIIEIGATFGKPQGKCWCNFPTWKAHNEISISIFHSNERFLQSKWSCWFWYVMECLLPIIIHACLSYCFSCHCPLVCPTFLLSLYFLHE